MKLLATLLALQCAGIGFLVWQSLGGAPARPTIAMPAAADVAAAVPADDERLRRIVREELAAQLATAAAGAPAPDRAAAVPPAPRDAEKDRLQRERVDRVIEHYRSVGAISEAQMAELQNDIAQLDATSRREMLRKLTRAMNAQEITGRM